LESLGGVERVTAAIQFSMSNNYAGVFPAKENRNEQVNTSNPARIAAPAGKYAKVGVRATTSGFTGARTEQQS
jgi:tRNA A37 threonylcarbamoyladenosine modification protein TsaB